MAGIPNDQYNDYLGNLNGIVKLRYAEGKIPRMYPDDTPLVAMLGVIKRRKMMGGQFVQPMKFRGSSGHTYAAAGAGAFAFRAARPTKVETALIDSTNHVHRGAIDYETIARTDNDKVPDGAFENAADEMIADVRAGMMTAIEESFWYGGTNHGVCKYNSASNSGGNLVVTLTYESFAPLLWLAKENSAWDFYLLAADGLRPSSTLYNNNATQSLADGTTTNAPMVLSAVELSTRTLTFTGAAADVNAIVAAVGNNSLTVGILPWGSKGNVTRGVDDVVTNTGSLYGISGYSLFKGNTSSNSNLELTLRRLYDHFDGPVNKGLNTQGMNGNGGLDIWLHPGAFRNLLANEAALRRYMEAGGTARNGFGGLEFDSEVGKLTFYPYGRVKNSELFAMPTKKVLEKVGAAEPFFQNFSTMKGSENASYLRQIEGVAACEAIMYGNMGLFVKQPAWCLKVTGIRSSNYSA